jgi:hypothetical protein
MSLHEMLCCDPAGHGGLYEITPTRHPGMLLAGVQQFKELDSGQKPAGMTKEEFHPSL